MKYIIYCTAGMKSNETMLSRSDERKFLLRREAWKIFRTSTGFDSATSRYRCDALTNWAMKPDVRSWSSLSSQLPVISNYEWKIYMKYVIYCTAVWNQMKPCCHAVMSGNFYCGPAPKVSGFIAQLVRASHRYRKVVGSNSVEVLKIFQASRRNRNLRSDRKSVV